MTNVFAIRNKASGEFLSFGSKCGWMTAGYAKMAFATHMPMLYDEQDKWEVVNLTEAYWRLEGLEK